MSIGESASNDNKPNALVIVKSHQRTRPGKKRVRDIRGKQKCDYKEHLYTHGGYHSWDADVVKNLTANEVEQITKSKKRSAENEDLNLAKHERFLLLASYLFYRSAIKSSEE